MIDSLKFLRAASFALFLGALSGCSATDHTAAVTTFAEATAAAETALVGLNQTVTKQYEAYLEQQARTDPGLAVKAGQNECELGSTRCRVVIVDPTAEDGEQPFPPEPLLNNMVAVMGDIRAYAQKLAALLANGSAAKAEADVNAALGNIESLADTLAKADGKGTSTIPNFTTPVGAAVNWLVGQYANHVKLEGLKSATRHADPTIQRAVELFAVASVFGSDPQRSDLTEDFRNKIIAFQDDRASRSNLTAAVDAAATYDRFLVSVPSAIFTKMGEAHAALTEALNNPDFSLPEMFRKIKAFAAEAEKLSKTVNDLATLTGDR